MNAKNTKGWIHNSKAGMHLTGAMASKDGRLHLPTHYRARARAFMAEDLEAARHLRMAGQKIAARMRIKAARQDRLFITDGAPALFG